jgi:hypothetical protein
MKAFVMRLLKLAENQKSSVGIEAAALKRHPLASKIMLPIRHLGKLLPYGGL